MQRDPRFDFQLEAELAGAGAIARSAADQAPSPAFAFGLRSQLLTEHATGAAFAVRALPRRRSRFSRFAPVFAAIVALLLATVVAAGAYRIFGPPPAATPQATPNLVVVGLPGGATFTPTPSPTPTDSPTPSPSPTASPTPSPSPIPALAPTPAPTPVPTPKPTPVPTPAPTPAIDAMSLNLTGCPGGVVIGWSPISNPAFAKYRTLRSSSPEIPVAYPPQGGAVEVGTAKSATISASSGFDSSSGAGYYRTLALDGSGRVIAASGIGSAAAQVVQWMGPLAVNPDVEGTRLSWTPFGGAGGCFTYYKLVYTLDGTAPSYLEGDPSLLASGDQGQATHVTAELISGQTYTFRLQVIRATDTGSFLVAETDMTSYTAP